MRERLRSPAAAMPANPMEGDGETSQVDIGRIGHEDASQAWMRLEGQQAWVEVTLRNGEEIVASVADEVRDLSLGDTVVIVYVDGDPGQAQVVTRRNDNTAPMAASVAGVSTGAAATKADGAVGPAPTFTFARTRDGRLFALETGDGGDILLHSGGDVHIKAGATHIEGAVRLGAGPLTPPVGSKVAPENGETPGVPMVPFLPLPGVNATIPPYVGFANGVVRASDEYQSNPVIDPDFFAKLNGLLAMFELWATALPLLEPGLTTWKAIPPVLPLPPFIAMNSKAVSASQNVTAED